MKCSRRPLKTFEQICQEDAMENVRQNWAPKCKC